MDSILKILLIRFFLFLFLHSQSYAQVDTVFRVEEMKKNTDFAKLTLGIDILVLQGATTHINSVPYNIHNQFVPRLTLGGSHFWGHADFYVSFPLTSIPGKKSSTFEKVKMTESVETGFKVYPYAMKPGRFSPYIGMSFQPFVFTYLLKDEPHRFGSSKYIRFISPVQMGVTYSMNHFLFSAGARYNWRNRFDYHYSHENIAPTTIRKWNFNVSFLWHIDTDKGYSSPHSVDQMNKKLHVLKKEDARSSWYVAMGPSTALQMSKSTYLKNNFPFMYEQMLVFAFVPELAFGKYFHKGNWNLNVAARHMQKSQKAFGTKLTTQRTSVALEAYKFLFNYRGFVPFVGPSLNIEKLLLHHSENATYKDTKMALGIVFGWDINLSNVETSLLRTNLRYMPGHHLDVQNDKMMFDFLEFNFIQYVYFFGRARIYKKYSSKQ